MLTLNQIDSFHANGFLVMPGVFRGEELRSLTEAADRVQAEGIAREDELSHRYMAGADGSEVYWRSENLWMRDSAFRAATVNPELLENIGQCIGQAFYPWNDSLVVKLPGNGAPVLWHQDPPYRYERWAETFPVPNFTTDIYLDASDGDNGGVWAIPGHHLVGHIDLAKEEDWLFERAIPLELQPGDVLFHALSTPHGSRGNMTGRQRRTVYLHYLAEAVYQDGYAWEDWAATKPGWSAAKRGQIEAMMEERGELGLEETLSRGSLRLGSNGIEFTGDPTTPPRWWGELSARLSEEERRDRKALKSV